MPLSFPISPYVNQIYTFERRSWFWNGHGWDSIAATNDLIATGVYMTSNQNASGLFYVNFSSLASGIDSVKTDNDFLWNSNTNSLVLASGLGVLQAIVDGGTF